MVSLGVLSDREKFYREAQRLIDEEFPDGSAKFKIDMLTQAMVKYVMDVENVQVDDKG